MDMRAIAEMDSVLELEYTKRYFEPGEWRARVAYFDGILEVIEAGEYFLMEGRPEVACVLERVEIEDGGDSVVVLSGATLAGVLRRRVVVPEGSDNFFRVVAQSSEDIMHSFVTSQAIAPADARRAIGGLEVVPSQGRGARASWRATFWDNLADTLTEIGEFAGLGYDVRLCLQRKKLVFEVLEGRDLSSAQKERPMVVFGAALDNIGRVIYDDNSDSYRNAIYAVTGDVEAGEFVAHLARSEGAMGMGLREAFYNATSHATELSDLSVVARMRLEDRARMPVISAQVLDTDSFRYMQDWGLGDIVTVVHSRARVVIHQRITEVVRVVSPSGRRMEVKFGTDHADPVRILQRIRNKSLINA